MLGNCWENLITILNLINKKKLYNIIRYLIFNTFFLRYKTSKIIFGKNKFFSRI